MVYRKQDIGVGLESNIFIERRFCGYSMAKKKGDGFQSSAGLVRYFDTDDDSSIKISPYWVIGACIVISIVVVVSSNLWPV